MNSLNNNSLVYILENIKSTFVDKHTHYINYNEYFYFTFDPASITMSINEAIDRLKNNNSQICLNYQYNNNLVYINSRLSNFPILPDYTHNKEEKKRLFDYLLNHRYIKIDEFLNNE